MKILVVGNGGREHVLVYKLAQSPTVTRIYCAPGNAGTADEPNTENLDIRATDTARLLKFCKAEQIDLAVIGPEAPLVQGMVDAFQVANVPVFGPTKAASVLEASYAVGLSGPGRLHDLLVTLDAVTPGELKARGAGLEIRYGFTPTPFGTALIASTARGLCHLGFHDRGSERAAAAALAAGWSQARLVQDDEAARATAARIFAPGGTPTAVPLRLSVRGTNFQLKVWQALLEVGAHGPTTYAEVALAAGVPGAERAVGNAVGANPVAWLIPCHNVLRADGSLGGYRWGEERKRAMLAFQARDIIRGSPQRPGRLLADRSVSA